MSDAAMLIVSVFATCACAFAAYRVWFKPFHPNTFGRDCVLFSLAGTGAVLNVLFIVWKLLP